MFYIVLGGIVLAAALAFGLGGRNAAQRLLDGAYEKGQAAMPQAREEMALAKERAAERAQEVRRSIDEPPGGEPGAGPPRRPSSPAARRPGPRRGEIRPGPPGATCRGDRAGGPGGPGSGVRSRPGGEPQDMDTSRTTDRRVARIPCGMGAPAEARRWAAWLRGTVEPATLEAIMVVVSELVTNAVRHAGLAAGAPIEVSGEVRRGRVTLMVRDRGVGLPAMAPPSAPPPSSAGSRGLYLVGRLSTRVLMDPPAGAVTCDFAR